MATSVGVKMKIDGEKEYKQSLKNIQQETKTLDAQLKSVTKSFDEEKNGMTKAEKQSELLKAKQEALNKELDQMNDYLEKVNEAYGENSIQAMKVEEQIAKTESKLADTNNALDNLASGSETSGSALEELTTTIADQESQLDDLREQYVNAVIEFGNGSDEANALAGEISSLSEELNSNKDTLDNATSSYDEIIGKQEEEKQAIDDMSTASETMSTVFGNTTSGIITAITAGDFMGAIGSVVDIFKDIVDAEMEVELKWQDAEAVISSGTSALGDTLETIKQQAREAWAAIGGESWTSEQSAQTTSNIITAFDFSDEDISKYGDQITALTEKFGKFQEVTGEDAAQTVFDLFYQLENMGELTGDASTDIATMSDTLETLYGASSKADVSASSMISALSDASAYFRDMNISTEEGIEILSRYVAAGGNISTYTSSLKKFYNAMSDETENVNLAWSVALEKIKDADSVNEAIADTVDGVALSSSLGKNAVQDLWKALHSKIVPTQQTWNEELDTAKSRFEEVYQVNQNINDKLDETSKKMENLTGVSSGLLNTMLSIGYAVSWFFGGGETIESLTTVANAAGNMTDEQKSGFANYMSNVNWGDEIKKFFGFADGYDQAYLLNSPTIFGQSASGVPLVGGDRAGSEVVVGESHLLSMIQNAVSSDGKLDTMINLLAQYLPQMNNQNIYLDGDVLVGQTAGKMDRALGRLS